MEGLAITVPTELVPFSLNDFLRPVPIESEYWGHKDTTALIVDYVKDLEEEVVTLYKECKEDNWNDNGEKGLTYDACEFIKQIIRILPLENTEPSLVPEPSGNIGIEWQKGSQKNFIVSVDKEGGVVYSFISKRRQRTGYLNMKAEEFHEDELLDEIKPFLEDMVKDERK